MKLKTMIAVIAIITMSAFIFSTAAEKEKAAAPSVSSMKCQKFGIVSVSKILLNCKRGAKGQQELKAESDKIKNDIKKLSDEINTDTDELDALKPNSADYSIRLKELIEKRAKLQAQREFYKQQMEMKQQMLIEQIFKDVMKATAEVAKEKSIDLVFERSEPDLPAANYNELFIKIYTHKVLYNSDCCEDMTDAVLAKVDANTQ